MKKSILAKHVLLLFLLLIVPSFRAIFKFTPYPIVGAVVYSVGCGLFFFFLLNKSCSIALFNTVLNWRPLSYALCILYAVVTFIVYPLADALKNMGRGSTADDAIIQPALTLLNTGKLYDVTLYGGVPISPGPGWIILNSPLVLLNGYWLLTAVYITITVLVFRYFFDKGRQTNLVLILLSSSLIFWELLVTGHDLIALGFAFVLFLSLSVRISQDQFRGYFYLVLFALLAGACATSRVVFAGVPVLLSLFFWKFDRKKAMIFGVISLLVCATLHGYFYLINDNYQPFHLFSRGRNNVGEVLLSLGLVATIIALFFVYARLKNTIESWLVSFTVCLAIPLATVSFGEFLKVGLNYALWEGANYLVPIIPPYLFFLARKVCCDNAKE